MLVPRLAECSGNGYFEQSHSLKLVAGDGLFRAVRVYQLVGFLAAGADFFHAGDVCGVELVSVEDDAVLGPRLLDYGLSLAETLQHVGSRRAQSRVFLEHIPDERCILGALDERAELELAAAVEGYPAVDDLAFSLTLLELVREIYGLGKTSCEVEVEYQSEGENVRFFGYFFAYLLALVLAVGVFSELGGVVIYRADYLVGLFVDEVAAVEVDELRNVVAGLVAYKQDVFELEVAVDNALAVNAEKRSGSGLHKELLYIDGETCEYALGLVVVDSSVNEFSRLDVLIALDEFVAGDNDISARACDSPYRGVYTLAGIDEVVEELLVMREGLGVESAVIYRCNRGLVLFEEVFLARSYSGSGLTALAVFPFAYELVSVEFH